MGQTICGYKTRGGTPCQHPVTGVCSRCAAGHPVERSRTFTYTLDPNPALVAWESGTIDFEDIAISSPGEHERLAMLSFERKEEIEKMAGELFVDGTQLLGGGTSVQNKPFLLFLTPVGSMLLLAMRTDGNRYGDRTYYPNAYLRAGVQDAKRRIEGSSSPAFAWTHMTSAEDSVTDNTPAGSYEELRHRGICRDGLSEEAMSDDIGALLDAVGNSELIRADFTNVYLESYPNRS